MPFFKIGRLPRPPLIKTNLQIRKFCVIPEVKVMVPVWVVFGFTGLLISRHRLIYDTKTAGPRDEQRIAEMNHEFVPRPHVLKILGYAGLLAFTSQVAWSSGICFLRPSLTFENRL